MKDQVDVAKHGDTMVWLIVSRKQYMHVVYLVSIVVLVYFYMDQYLKVQSGKQ